MEKTKERKFPWDWILLGVLGLVFLASRIIWQIPAVFTPDGILFREVDPYYHMRLAEAMLHNFPTALRIDQFAVFGGATVGMYPLVSWTVASVSWIVGFGSPTESLVRTVGVLIPPILGMLCLIPVYLIGRRLFSKTISLVSCLFMIILPTEFFHRTLLGFIDHHVFEVFFALWSIYFLVKIYLDKLWKWSIGLGVALGLYLLNWSGGLFFIAIILLWIVAQYLIDYLKREPIDSQTTCTLVIGLVIAGVLATPIVGTSSRPLLYLVTYFMFLVPLILYGLTRTRKWIYLGTHALVIMTAIIILVLSREAWVLVEGLVLAVFGGFQSSIGEAQSMNIETFFYAFGVCTLLFIGGLVIWLWKGKKTEWLLIVFTVIMLAASISQRRWSYYLVFPVSLYSAYLINYIAGSLKERLRPIAVIMVVLMLTFMGLQGAFQISVLKNNITPDWNNALVWLKENTPEPFEDPKAYTKLVPITKCYPEEVDFRNQTVSIPFNFESCRDEAKYSVLSWWDYGHYIIYLAHRVPLTNPAQQIMKYAEVERFLTSQSSEEALEIIKDLKVKYVIVDEDMVGGKMYAFYSRVQANLSQEELQRLKPTTEVVRIWNGQEPNFKLIHDQRTVRIFEYIDGK